MGKITGLLALVGLWTLAATQGEAALGYNVQDIQDIFDDPGQAKTYIVHVMDHAAPEAEAALSTYTELLQTLRPASTLGDLVPAPAILPVHVYSSACHGFSARLTSEEAEALRQVDGVLGVFPDSVKTLHTTRSPDFLGLTSSLRSFWHGNPKVQDVIVGMIDTGVWPESESFNDAGMDPIPARWKGKCQHGQEFNSSHCNKKLIGARWYFGETPEQKQEQLAALVNTSVKIYISPRDENGHGTHTASTAAGALVPNANLFGAANGTARGMAPKARIAVYKVCWLTGFCMQSDILKAIDQAVADGVDVISLSLGGPPIPYAKDSLAIGTFGAMMKGIFVSCSAGNDGPGLQTVTNAAPWMMTVAASTLDRAFPANVQLGDGQVIPGQSMYQIKSAAEEATQLITGESAALSNATKAVLCLADSLDPALVKGKIVVCERGENARVEKGSVVLKAGGAGMILYNTDVDGDDTFADAHFLPATHVGAKAGATLLSYMKKTPNPVGEFQFIGTKLGVSPAPAIAGFSSRGPNVLTPELLKPDITAPGVSILAAWSQLPSLTRTNTDTRRVAFNIISGTSMSCPHVSGLAALLKAARPEWSTAAIKSAMMTTATQIDNTGGNITDTATLSETHPFAFGAGHVRPDRALNPGLVYDMGPQDYVNFLCASNISIGVFVGNGTGAPRCPAEKVELEHMNYPSFSAVFKEPPSNTLISMKMKRTVTNVGSALSTYTSQIVGAPPGIRITVTPKTLRFNLKYQQKKFTVKIKTVNAPDPSLVNATVTEFASLVWSDEVHSVRSPIAITFRK